MRHLIVTFLTIVVLQTLSVVRADDNATINLFDNDLAAFKSPTGWTKAANVKLDPKNDKALVKDGEATADTKKVVFATLKKGKDLHTKEKFGDVEVHLEFMVTKGANTGIKFHDHYEVQIFDSYGKTKVTGEDCGGIYPRAEGKPSYHHIDEGIAPKVNACKKPGEWQTLDVTFQAPRFDDKGKKTENARIVKATLNGQLIHENVELLWPTGDKWHEAEMAYGPFMIQGDHGVAAFRDVQIKPLNGTKK